MRTHFCLPCLPFHLAQLLYSLADGLNSSPFLLEELSFRLQQLPTTLEAASEREKVHCTSATQHDQKQMEHYALWVFRFLMFQLMHHFQLEEGPCFSLAQTTLTTRITYGSNFNSFFLFGKKKKKHKTTGNHFFLFYFFFSFLHIIHCLMKSRLLAGQQRNIYC